MSFKRDLTEILDRFATGTYDFIDKAKRRPFSNTLLTGSWFPEMHDPVAIRHGFMEGCRNESSHRKLLVVSHSEARRADILALRDLIDAHAPAVGIHERPFTLELRTRSKSGKPRMRLDLAGHKLAPDPLQIATIVKRLERTVYHLRHVPRSKARLFRIHNHTIPARDAYDALRIYAALAFPGTLDNPPHHIPQIEIAELLDHRPLVQALFSEQDDGEVAA